MPENCILCPIFQGTPVLHFHSADRTFAQVHYSFRLLVSVSCYHLGKKGNISNVRLVAVHRPVVDLKRREGRPQGFKFFQFLVVLGQIWQNCMLAPPLEGWRPHLGEMIVLVEHEITVSYVMPIVNLHNSVTNQDSFECKQECIPVGCVPSAAVAVSPTMHAPLPHTHPPATHAPPPAMHAPYQACPTAMHAPCYVPPAMHAPQPCTPPAPCMHAPLPHTHP